MIERILINLNLKNNRKLFYFLFYGNVLIMLFAFQNIIFEISAKIMLNRAARQAVNHENALNKPAPKQTGWSNDKYIPLDYFTHDERNLFGGKREVFAEAGSSIKKNILRDGTVMVLMLDYVIRLPQARCGCRFHLNGKDISECKTLLFALNSSKDNPDISIEFGDGNSVSSLALSSLYEGMESNVWYKIIIPVEQFPGLAQLDRRNLSFSIALDNTEGAFNYGTLKVRNVGFLK